jgi:hypothetical protein
MMSIVCQVEGWVVRKGPFCEKCYWYEPGTDKDVACAEPPVGCEAGRPVRTLGNDE